MPKFERTVEIDSDVEKVWKVLINPHLYPQWFPGIDSVSHVNAVQTGGTFEWSDGDKVGTGEFVDVKPFERLEIMTVLGNDRDKHIFELRKSGGFLGLAADEAKVEYTLDTLMGGGILGNFVAGGNPVDALRIKKAIVKLRKLVESL